MKRAEEMMASRDVLTNLAIELRKYPDDAKQLLLSLNLTPEQKAVLTKASISDQTEEKKLLNDVYDALHLTEAQTKLLTDALGINELTASAVQALYKLKTLHSARCFLIDLYRHGIVYYQGQPVARNAEGYDFVVKQETKSTYSPRQVARVNGKSFAGYQSYQELEKLYGEKNAKGYADKFAYLLCQYQVGEELTEEAKIKNTAIQDLRNTLDYSKFWNVHDLAVRDELLKSRISVKKVVTGDHVRNAGFSDDQAQKYANYFVEGYSGIFWTIAEKIYNTLNNTPNVKTYLLSLRATDFHKIDGNISVDVNISDELKNEANTHSDKWKEVLEILTVIMTKNSSAAANTHVAMYNSSQTRNNNNNNNIKAFQSEFKIQRGKK